MAPRPDSRKPLSLLRLRGVTLLSHLILLYWDLYVTLFGVQFSYLGRGNSLLQFTYSSPLTELLTVICYSHPIYELS